jgi:NADH dehydrogenase
LIHILILGGGFAGIEVLRIIQRKFRSHNEICITLVSRDNFFLYTPMLPEVASGSIETRHIATPIRAFCKQAVFYEAIVKAIDLEKKEVVIWHAIQSKQQDTSELSADFYKLKYDYLVIALGGETNFFGMEDVENTSFTIKSLGDAIVIRNHIIDMLERAELEHENEELKRKLMTFVVIGAGFAGVETAGELNDFIRTSIRDFYRELDASKDVKVVLVDAIERLLPEVTEDLGQFALKKLHERGIEIRLNTPVVGANTSSVKLKDGSQISTFTLIWAGGVTPEDVVKDLPCDHDRAGRITVNEYLQVHKYPGVFVVGDSASIIDPHTRRPYPPTAQHAIREGQVAARNLISMIMSGREPGEAEEEKSGLVPIEYKTKGMMAMIGKRNGVGNLLGLKVHGFVAWWIWRTYYLTRLPTVEKKLRVMFDWTMDIFFKPDVTRLKTFTEKEKR